MDITTQKFLNYLQEIRDYEIINGLYRLTMSRLINLTELVQQPEMADIYEDLLGRKACANTLLAFFDNSNVPVIFTDFIILSEILDDSGFNRREIFQIVSTILELNFERGILAVPKNQRALIIDANAIARYHFKNISKERIESLLASGGICDLLNSDDSTLTTRELIEKEELLANLDKYSLDTETIVNAIENIKQHYFDKKDTYSSEDIATVLSSLRELHAGDKICEIFKSFLFKQLNSRKVNVVKENVTSQETITPKVVVEKPKKKKHNLTNRVYRDLKSTLEEYYSVHHQKLMKPITFDEMLEVICLMIKMGIDSQEIDIFVKIANEHIVKSYDNPVISYLSLYERFKFYYNEEDLSLAQEYFSELGIASDEDYEFWKNELVNEITKLNAGICDKSSYEINLAKKKTAF